MLEEIVDKQILDRIESLIVMAGLSGYRVEVSEYDRMLPAVYMISYGIYSGDWQGISLDFSVINEELKYGLTKLNGQYETSYPMWSTLDLVQILDKIEELVVNEQI